MSFQFAHLTDTHLYASSETGPCPDPPKDEVFLNFHEEVAEHNVDFMVNTGDLNTGGAGGELSRYEHFMNLMDKVKERTGIPVYVTRGNHDFGRIQDADYENTCGTSTFWFEHEGWAFLVFDHYWGSYEIQPDFYGLVPAGLERLEAVLDEIPREMPMIIMMHQNPTGTTHFHRGELLYERLKSWNVKLLLFGHVQNNYLSTYQGIPHMTVVGQGGSFDSAPLTYNIVTCHDDGSFETDWYPHTRHIPAVKQLLPPQTGGFARPDTEWRDHRGPHGNRSSSDTLSDNAPSLTWSATLPGRFAVGCPTVADGRVVVGTKSRGRYDQCCVAAFDAKTGEEQWRIPADGSVEGGILLHEGRGYFGTTAGTICCINLEDGREIWRWNNGENLPFASMPVLDEGLLHIGANWESYAIKADNGECVWRKLATTRGISYFCPGHASALIIGDRVFHQRPFNGRRQSLVQAFDKTTGANQTLGAMKYADFPGQRQASPVLWNDKLLTVGGGLVCFAPEDLEEDVFMMPMTGATTPAITGDMAFISYHQYIRAHDLREDGKVVWEIPHEGARYQFSGGIRWTDVYHKQCLPAGNYAAPVATEDKLLIADTGGHLRCLKTKDGGECWRVDMEDAMLCAPTISGNTIYVGDFAGNLYALASE